MSREDPQMKLRMSPHLRDLIVDAAAANKRSMNAEIVARLEASFDAQAEVVPTQVAGRLPFNLDAFMDKLQAKYDRLCESIEAKSEILEAENVRMQAEINKLTIERLSKSNRRAEIITLPEAGGSATNPKSRRSGNNDA